MHDNWLHSSYVQFKQNTKVDTESRILPPETEWKLADWAFKQIMKNFGEFDIDLFASILNEKCDFFYAFAPFSVIKAKGVVVVPYWPPRPWLSVFTSLMVLQPIYFQLNRGLLICNSRKIHPLLASLTLVAAQLSRRVLRWEEPQKYLLQYIDNSRNTQAIQQRNSVVVAILSKEP